MSGDKASQDSEDPFVVLGRIGAPFGIHGFVHVHSFAHLPQDLLKYDPWHLKIGGQWQPFKVIEARPHGKGFVAKLGKCEDRDEAAKLTNLDIGIHREKLPDLETGDYYWVDLLGLNVLTEDGHCLGKVTELFETGSNDVLVVQGETREHLIPYVPEEYIVSVDLNAGEMRVRWDPEF